MRRMKTSVSIVLILSMLLSISSFVKGADTSEFNYTDAFAKSILFYEANWCGADAGSNRLKWRGPCHVEDGKDVGVDLTGGFHDCGDHVKFGLPQTYAASTLGWAYYEFKDAFIAKGQDEYMLNINKHFCDYFMKSLVEDTTFYYQVGNGDTDHSYWGPPEMQATERTAFYVANPKTPGSDVAGNASAALSLMYLNYKDRDLEYSQKCLDTAKRLYEFGKKYRGNSKAQTYYTPASYYDELMWGAIWLSVATGDKSYLDDVETYMTEKGIGGDKVEYYNHWTHCWDDVFGGVFLMMSQLSDKPKYKEATEENLSFWMNELKTTPGGLRYLHEWACLKYVASESFLALVYNKYNPNQKYIDFAKSQIDYILGDNPRNSSYVVGFGENYPLFPHHRAASGRLEGELTREDKDDPERHILYGALVGGPQDDDSYVDDINKYVYTEVGLDYNAGFVGAMAGMTELYGKNQEPEEIPNIESGPAEYSLEAQYTYENNQQTVINANVYNVNMAPPHFEKDITIRYFVDLSEFYEKGLSVNNVKTGIAFTDNGAKITGLIPWDESKHMYFAEIYWPSTVQMFGKSQVQFKIYTTNSTCYDATNDYSRDGLLFKPDFIKTECIPVYKNGILVYGKEPYKDPTLSITPTPVVYTSPTPAKDLEIQMYNAAFFSANQIAPKFCIINPTDKTLDLSTVKIRYYYTIDGEKDQVFLCDYTTIGDDNVTATFVKMDEPTSTADHYMEIGFKTGTIAPGESTSISTRVWKNDWSDIDQTNDYSYNEAGGDYEDWSKVTGYINGELEWGSVPGEITVTPTPTPTPSVELVYGDVTGDGKVDSGDYLIMRKYLLRIIKQMPSANWQETGNLNNDRVIDSGDYTLLKRYLLGIIKKLPV